ncbi:MAG: hypothetical protein ABFS42_06310 [Candidatus Krumholzibacteriota bacterium]
MKPLSFFLPVILAALLADNGPAVAQAAKPLTGAFDPEQVLANLEETVAERDWKRYGDFLAENFRFVPFPSVTLEHPPVEWDLWDREREIGFIQEMVSPNKGATLVLLDNVLVKGSESKGRSEWDLVYTLNFGGQEHRSRAIFVFEKVDKLWYLREWIDTTIETDKKSDAAFPTSGTLRASLSR